MQPDDLSCYVDVLTLINAVHENETLQTRRWIHESYDRYGADKVDKALADMEEQGLLRKHKGFADDEDQFEITAIGRTFMESGLGILDKKPGNQEGYRR